MKRLVYRFALWLENVAYDLQYWAEPPIIGQNLNDIVIGGINRDPNPIWRTNALLNTLQRADDHNPS